MIKKLFSTVVEGVPLQEGLPWEWNPALSESLCPIQGLKMKPSPSPHSSASSASKDAAHCTSATIARAGGGVQRGCCIQNRTLQVRLAYFRLCSPATAPPPGSWAPVWNELICWIILCAGIFLLHRAADITSLQYEALFLLLIIA